MWRKTLMVCIMGFFWWNIAIAACKAENSVLDLNDDSSRKLLRQMSSEGNLKDNKLFAGAWIVVSSVALGMGLEKCHFPKPDDMSFMWKPAKVQCQKMKSSPLTGLSHLISVIQSKKGVFF